MHGKSSSPVIRSLVMIVLVAATLAPTIRGHEVDAAPAQNQTTRNQAGSPPLILAQGRCFNGVCY
jgi:hypothetical protein